MLPLKQTGKFWNKNKVPYCTNMSTAQACIEAIKSLKTKKLEVTSLQDI